MRLSQIQLMLGVSALVGTIGICSGSAAQQSAIDRGVMLKNICVQTLQVGRSAVDLDACTSSLSDSLSVKLQIAHEIDIERHCSASGPVPGTADFYKCAVDGEAANPLAKPTNEVVVVFGMPHLQGLGSDLNFGSSNYYGMSFDTKRHQEEEACAQI